MSTPPDDATGSDPRDDELDLLLRSAYRRDDRWTATAMAPGHDLDAPLPEFLGRYPVIERIGLGGVGEVYRVHDQELGRTVALKVLRATFMDLPEHVQLFVDEAHLCSQLAHPGIVPVHETGKLEDGRPYFTMRLVEGETFAAILRRQGDSTEDRMHALEILHKTAETLGYAHAHAIVHGDVKPQNVMVGAFGEVQVMDWGFARRAGDRARRAVHRAGTPAYMAPEQASPDAVGLTPRTDVFGLGGLLCEMLTGAPPYAGDSRTAVIALAAAAQLETTTARLRATSADEALIRLALDCLHPDPGLRPQDAGAVAQRIASYQNGIEQRAREAELSTAKALASLAHGRRAQRLAIALVTAIAAAVLIVTLLVVFMLWRRNERRTANRMAVDKAVTEAQQLATFAPERWGKTESMLADALTTVRHAGSLARSIDGDPAALPMLDAFEQELLARGARARRARELLDRLGKLKSHEENDRPFAEIDAEYQQAFAELATIAASSNSAAVQAALEIAHVRNEVIQGLDDWCYLRRRHALPDAGAWRQPLETVRRIDRDPWRTELRRAWEMHDVERLLALAKAEIDAHQEVFSLHLLGQSLVDAGHVAEAIEFFGRACSLHPEDPRLCHALARLRRTGGPFPDPAEERRLLWMANASQPDDAHLLVDLALALLEAKDAATAFTIVERAIRLRPGEARAWYVLAQARSALERPRAEVREALDRASELGSWGARMMMADELQRDGRIAEALTILEDLQKRDSGQVAIVHMLAVLEARIGRADHAVRLLLPHRDAPGDKGRIDLALAEVWLEAGEFARAAALCAQIEAMAKGDAAVASLAGETKRRAQDYAELRARLPDVQDTGPLPASPVRLRALGFVARRCARAGLAAKAYAALLARPGEFDGEFDGDDCFDGALAALAAADLDPGAREHWHAAALEWLGRVIAQLEAVDLGAPEQLLQARNAWHRLTMHPALWMLRPDAAASRPEATVANWQPLRLRLEALARKLGLEVRPR